MARHYTSLSVQFPDGQVRKFGTDDESGFTVSDRSGALLVNSPGMDTCYASGEWAAAEIEYYDDEEEDD